MILKMKFIAPWIKRGWFRYTNDTMYIIRQWDKWDRTKSLVGPTLLSNWTWRHGAWLDSTRLDPPNNLIVDLLLKRKSNGSSLNIKIKFNM